MAELESGQAPLGRVRREGAGRKPVTATDLALLAALLALVEPTRRGHPESSLCWTTLTTRKLAAELTALGHQVGADTVARLLREQGFSLQGNPKTLEGGQHPVPDVQFSYINEQAPRAPGRGRCGDQRGHQEERTRRAVPQRRKGTAPGDPEQVKVHDFIDPSVGKANPYGVYDLGADAGWVAVGHRPRHRRVRRGHDPPLVAVRRSRVLPDRVPTADHRRRRRIQRLPHH